MEITEVRIFPVDEEHLRAHVRITIDDCFVIRDMKIIRGPRGHFVDMPYRLGSDGRRREIVSMRSTDARNMLEEKVFAAYEKLISEPVARRKLGT